MKIQVRSPASDYVCAIREDQLDSYLANGWSRMPYRVVNTQKRLGVAQKVTRVTARFNLMTATLDQYRSKCAFRINGVDLSKIDGYDQLIANGWYHKTDNTNGVVRDHKFSIADGYQLKIDPYIVRHPANCELMSTKANARKRHLSSITIDELMDRIRNW